MNFITRKHIPRRTFLRSIGATTIALPFMDAMTPAGVVRAASASAAGQTRLVAIEMVHGAAGSNEWGASQYLWNPKEVGRNFEFGPSALSPLEPFRDYLTIISNTDVRMAEAVTPPEIGGDHFRSSAVFLTHAHPKQTQGSDYHVATSLDQLYAQRFGKETPIPSMQLCIENVDQAGGCAYGYTCVYTDSISWASPTRPLPVIRSPRVAFEQLFGVGATAAERSARSKTQGSILDWVGKEVTRLRQDLGHADQLRMDAYLESVREVERRIQMTEARNAANPSRALPDAPSGVPDSFEDHVKLMFDLQVLAFQGDVTRVFSFKMGRDASGRVYPESGSDRPFHTASHHGGKDKDVLEFNKINKYHVGMLPYFLTKLKNAAEGDSNLLEKSMIIYGSPMSDSNLHAHRRAPLIVLGHANGTLQGGVHVKAPDGTSMADPMLSLLHKLGHDDMTSFGDSSGTFEL